MRGRAPASGSVAFVGSLAESLRAAAAISWCLRSADDISTTVYRANGAEQHCARAAAARLQDWRRLLLAQSIRLGAAWEPPSRSSFRPGTKRRRCATRWNPRAALATKSSWRMEAARMEPPSWRGQLALESFSRQKGAAPSCTPAQLRLPETCSFFSTLIPGWHRAGAEPGAPRCNRRGWPEETSTCSLTIRVGWLAYSPGSTTSAGARFASTTATRRCSFGAASTRPWGDFDPSPSSRITNSYAGSSARRRRSTCGSRRSERARGGSLERRSARSSSGRWCNLCTCSGCPRPDWRLSIRAPERQTGQQSARRDDLSALPFFVRPDQLGLRQHVALHRLLELRLGGGSEIREHRVESVQLVKIPMLSNRRTRPAVAGALPVVH